MKSFYLISMPRSGSEAVAWMLERMPGQRCLLRSNMLGRQGWKAAVKRWSELLRKDPEAVMVFTIREADAAAELSLEGTWPRWIPRFGKCSGRVWKRWKQMRQSMLDFHEMNPRRTVVLPLEEMEDRYALGDRLSDVGLCVAVEDWEQVMEERPGNLQAAVQEIFPEGARALPAGDADPEGIEGDADPFAEKETGTDADVDPWASDDEVPVVKHVRRKPRRFIESPAEHARAIVYPWLASAARWDELRYSLRSIERHFADKECPIYILGDAAPEWLVPGGRVRWRAMQGYAQSREEGMWQALVTGVQLAEEVLWMNDDIYLLKDLGWDDFHVPLSEGWLDEDAAGEMRASKNKWLRGMAQSVGDLLEQFPARGGVWRFATHTPMRFERPKAVEVLRRYHQPWKGGWANLYFNHHWAKHAPVGRWKTRVLPARYEHQARFLNHGAKGPDVRTRGELVRRFGEAAAWEKPAAVVPKRIHQTWKTGDIPADVYPEEWRWSWGDLHPGWDYMFWTDEGLLDLARRWNPEFVELFERARGAVKADVGRLLVLHHFGGLYADLDYLALRPMDELVQGGSVFLCTLGSYTHNALMAGVAGHPFWLECAREALRRWQEKPDERPEWVSGPELVEKVARRYQVTRWGREVCPLDWRKGEHEGDWRELVETRCGGAWAVTFWRGGWKGEYGRV